MIWTMLASLCLAGDLVVEAHVPVDVYLDGQGIAQLFRPTTLRAAANPGPAKLTLMMNGNPHHYDVEIPETGDLRVLVGRTGVTTGVAPPPLALPTDGRAKVQFRASGDEPLTLTVDRTRHRLGAGGVLDLELDTGSHAMSLRNADGTVVWAQGTLELVGGSDDALLVQLSAGQMPEVAGEGGAYRPAGR